jgi:LysM repeat protein
MSASITTISTPLTAAIARTGVQGESSPQKSPARARLRLTRRGRAVFGALATLLVIGVLAVLATFSGAQAVASAETGSTEFGYVVVQPGDSLWQVASSIDPNVDPRDLVAEIVRLNQLDGSGVIAGQPIAVPLRYADAPGVVSASDLGL